VRRIHSLPLLIVFAAGSASADGSGEGAYEFGDILGPAAQLSSDAVDVKMNFAYAVDEGDPLVTFNPILMGHGPLDGQFHFLTGAMDYSDLVNLKFSQTVDDRFDPKAKFVRPQSVQDLSDYDRERTITTNLSLGFLKDRLSLSRQVSLSSIDETRFEFDDLTAASGSNLSAVEPGPETGTAVLERVDATLLRFGNSSVSLFGLRNTVNEIYQTLDDEDGRKKREDPLKVSNRLTYKYGIEAGLGPLSASLADFTYQPADEDRTSQPRERGYEAGLSLDLSGLRANAEGGGDQVLGRFAPTSVWVKYNDSMVYAGTDANAPEDSKTDVSVGGNWEWGGVYGSASYWRSQYDSRQIDEADWEGDGINLSAGYSKRNWGVNASFSLGVYENSGARNQSTDSSSDGTIAAWLDVEDLPSLSGSVSLGRYETDDHLYDSDSVSDYLNLGISMDFAKYLPWTAGNASRSLKLSYELDHTIDRTDSSEVLELLTDHIVFLRYSTRI
jgi:hypothetical protein